MARPVWSGSISFGLVNVPVKAYTAVRDHDVHFHQLDKRSGSRIHNRKVAEKTGEEVDDDDIELGFEVASGRYVTFERDELKELRPASTKAIDISDFVALAEIDPIYYERTYWLAPDGDAAKKAYDLLLAVMADRERVGIGSVVMRDKQYLTAVRPLDGVLAMSTMRFADEVVPRKEIDDLPARAGKADARALSMATQLVEGLAAPWKPEQYHDTYTEELRERIMTKDDKQVATEDDGSKTIQSGQVVDLMAALQASVDASKNRRGTANASAGTASRGKAAAGKTSPRKTTKRKATPRRSSTHKSSSRSTSSRKSA